MRPVKTNPSRLIGTALAVALVATSLLQTEDAHAKSGKEIFTTLCAACHTVGGGKRVGPDLLGVTERRKADWLVKFVKSSQSMVNAGDPVAKALLEEFKVPMPDQNLSDTEIKAVLEYTKQKVAGAKPAAPMKKATKEQVILGGKLFQGEVRLKNGGPSCVACHDVTNDAIISGGVLARELTTVFGRLGGGGVRAILGAPPFPVMQQAYADHPLEEGEVTALVGFLAEVSSKQKNHMPRDTGIMLAISGVVGVILLMGLYSVVWGRRRRGSVNQDIYDRQIKSSS